MLWCWWWEECLFSAQVRVGVGHRVMLPVGRVLQYVLNGRRRLKPGVCWLRWHSGRLGWRVLLSARGGLHRVWRFTTFLLLRRGRCLSVIMGRFLRERARILRSRLRVLVVWCVMRAVVVRSCGVLMAFVLSRRRRRWSLVVGGRLICVCGPVRVGLRRLLLWWVYRSRGTRRGACSSVVVGSVWRLRGLMSLVVWLVGRVCSFRVLVWTRMLRWYQQWAARSSLRCCGPVRVPRCCVTGCRCLRGLCFARALTAPLCRVRGVFSLVFCL